MSVMLSEEFCSNAEQPQTGNRVYRDIELRGLGFRVTAQNFRSFVLRYRTASGQERLHTIGHYPEINLAKARAIASDLKMQIRNYEADPVGDRKAQRIRRYRAGAQPYKRRQQRRVAAAKHDAKVRQDRAIADAVRALGLIQSGDIQ